MVERSFINVEEVTTSKKTLHLVFLVFLSNEANRQRIDKRLGRGPTINTNFWFIGLVNVIVLWMVLGTILNPFASKRGLIHALRLPFISVAKYSSDVRVHV